MKFGGSHDKIKQKFDLPVILSIKNDINIYILRQSRGYDINEIF